MKVGELKVLTQEQKEGIKKHDEERTKLVRIIEENHRTKPYPKRKNK